MGLPLTALIAIGNGAAIPEISGIDALLDMFSSNIADMENILESYGLTRNKRGAGSHAGYKTFGPVYGVQVGLKYKDEANKLAGGEAFIHFDDLQKLAPKAHSSEVEIHLKFDGGATPRDGIFDFEIDYHLTHSDGDGVEEGELNIVRKQVGGKWETKIETITKPFAGVPSFPKPSVTPILISNQIEKPSLNSIMSTLKRIGTLRSTSSENLAGSWRSLLRKMEPSLLTRKLFLMREILPTRK